MRPTARVIEAGYWRVRAVLAGLTARASSRRQLKSAAVQRILVVCYGNIYRSAFVGALIRTLEKSAVQVQSAGFHCVPMRPAPPRLVQMSEGFGVDLSQHRSTVVSREALEWADVILLMDRKNWVRLRRMGADPRKLVWLGAFAGGPIELEDPYEMSDRQLAALLERLDSATRQLVAQLCAVSSRSTV